MRTAFLLCVLFGLLALATAHATVYFHEKFENLDHWTVSKHRDDYGKVEISAGSFYADAEKSKGLHLTQDARFYALSTAIQPITNEKKDFVVSFSIKDDKDLRCGGGYIKLLPAMDPEKFNGDTKYWLMFGPDRCGSDKKVHIILHYNGKNYEWTKKNVYPHEDKMTHVYTLHITPDNKYEFFLDGESREKGELEDDWNMLEPREIVDPDDKKPDDWVDEKDMDDPDDKKPDDWEAAPETIPDPDAKRPEDWDDAEDGEWEAPSIPNPEFKGEWRPRRIPNPAYKGPWVPRTVPNPNFKPDENLYKIPEPIAHVGIDLWRVEGGSIFKDIIIGDDLNEVLDLVKKTYGSMKEAEQEAFKTMSKAKVTEEASKEVNEDEEVKDEEEGVEKIDDSEGDL